MRAQHLEPLFAAYADRVTARFFDAEAFNGRFSDFAVLETEDLGAYYFLIEALRDTPVIAEGYLTFSDVFLGVETASTPTSRPWRPGRRSRDRERRGTCAPVAVVCATGKGRLSTQRVYLA